MLWSPWELPMQEESRDRAFGGLFFHDLWNCCCLGAIDSGRNPSLLFHRNGILSFPEDRSANQGKIESREEGGYHEIEDNTDCL